MDIQHKIKTYFYKFFMFSILCLSSVLDTISGLSDLISIFVIVVQKYSNIRNFDNYLIILNQKITKGDILLMFYGILCIFILINESGSWSLND